MSSSTSSRTGGYDGGNEWIVCRDKKDGRIFYANQRTKETRWTKPIELATGVEREEMIRKQVEAKAFFKEMEANIKRKFNGAEFQSVQLIDLRTSFGEDIETESESKEKESDRVARRSFRTISAMDDEVNEMIKDTQKKCTVQGRLLATRRLSYHFDIEPEPECKSGDAKDILDDSTTVPRSPRERGLRRRNSTGTIYIGTTISGQDDNATIKCVCTIIRAHIMESVERDFVPSSSYDIFKDPIIKRDCKDVAARSGSAPSLNMIMDYFRSIFDRAQMESESIIMTLIYCERLVVATNGELVIRHDNWKSILFASLCMASKVWDDFTMWNSDFSHVCPSFDLARVNALECAVLDTLKYDVRVSASNYAKYYFHIRSMMTLLGYHRSEINSLRPLDIQKAKQMKLATETYINKATSEHNFSRRGRVASMPDITSVFSGTKFDNGKRGDPHRHPAVVLEQLMHEAHDDADGIAHTSLSSGSSGASSESMPKNHFSDKNSGSKGMRDYK